MPTPYAPPRESSWPTQITVNTGDHRINPLVGILIFLVIVGSVIFGFLQFAPQQAGQLQERGAVIAEEAGTVNWWQYIPFTDGNIWTSWWNERIAIATGKTQTGLIEQNKDTNLGVRVKPLNTISNSYTLGDKVTIFTTLTALTLGNEHNSAHVDCRSSKGDVAQEVTPSTLEIFGQISKPVDCRFDSLDVGAHVLSMTVDFDFTTISYLPTFFSSEDLLGELALKKKNFFSLYYPGQNPSVLSTSTAGPIQLNLGIGDTQPVPIDPLSSAEPLTLGITVRNIWDGKIAALHSLFLLSPKEFTLDPELGVTGAANPPERVPCARLPTVYEDSCDDELVNVYRIELKGEEIPKFKNFRAYFTTNNPSALLGNARYSQRSFSALAQYTYSFERTISVTVRPPEVNP